MVLTDAVHQRISILQTQTIDCGELQIAELQSQDPCFTPQLKNINVKNKIHMIIFQ
jgi:hypothetical protein